MDGRIAIAWVVTAAAALAGCAAKNTAPPLMAVAVGTEPRLGPGAVTESSLVSTEATVVAIDHETRMVTLRTPDQRLHTLRVDPSVRNLGKVRKGDEVVTTYYESIAVRMEKPGTARPGVSSDADTDRAPPGQRPAGVAAETTTLTATVVKIDRKHQSVDLRGPEGNLRTVDVQDPAHLQQLKVGDLVEVSITEAVAVQVEKAPKH
jgi:hypothetical protein